MNQREIWTAAFLAAIASKMSVEQASTKADDVLEAWTNKMIKFDELDAGEPEEDPTESDEPEDVDGDSTDEAEPDSD